MSLCASKCRWRNLLQCCSIYWATYSQVCLGDHTYVMGNCLDCVSKQISFLWWFTIQRYFCRNLRDTWRRMEKVWKTAPQCTRIAERYHEPVRRTSRKLRIDHRRPKKELLPSLAIKAWDDALWSEEVVPTALVFGQFPSMYSFLGPRVPRVT